jgi:subtilase family serine protease
VVANEGDLGSEEATVTLLVRGKPPTVVRLPPIPPGRRHGVRLELDGLQGVVRIDPKNAVAEADETNNQARVRGCQRIGGR